MGAKNEPCRMPAFRFLISAEDGRRRAKFASIREIRVKRFVADFLSESRSAYAKLRRDKYLVVYGSVFIRVYWCPFVVN